MLTPQLQNTMLPPGAITAFAGNVQHAGSPPPSAEYTTLPEAWGWMVCDGRSLQASQYPELFSTLGYLYGGSGDQFNIPDLRGMFLRAVGTDAASTEQRTAAPGGAANEVGSTQKYALQDHLHTYTSPNEPAPFNQGEATSTAVQADTAHAPSSGPQQNASEKGNVQVSAYETRPSNVFVYYLIKYTTRLPNYIQG